MPAMALTGLLRGAQAEQSVRVAAEAALRASQAEVQALSAKARRSEKRRKRLQTTMEGITEASQQPILTHGQPFIYVQLSSGLT